MIETRMLYKEIVNIEKEKNQGVLQTQGTELEQTKKRLEMEHVKNAILTNVLQVY